MFQFNRATRGPQLREMRSFARRYRPFAKRIPKEIPFPSCRRRRVYRLRRRSSPEQIRSEQKQELLPSRGFLFGGNWAEWNASNFLFSARFYLPHTRPFVRASSAPAIPAVIDIGFLFGGNSIVSDMRLSLALRRRPRSVWRAFATANCFERDSMTLATFLVLCACYAPFKHI